ncbi:hypothetical protein Y695_03552 [Hydrogenophaga sp. T4]|nr:hypothetical protein Y695_03552 [Hydrogenophaga sp. T4]
MAAVLAPVAEETAPRLAGLQAGPEFAVAATGCHARLQQPRVAAQQLFTRVARGACRGLVDVFDVGGQIGDDDGLRSLLGRHRQLAQPAFVLAAAADVAQDPHLVPVVQRCDHLFKTAHLAIGVPVVPLGALRAIDPLKRIAVGGRPTGRADKQALDGPVAQLGRAAPEQPLGLRIDIENALLCIDDQDAERQLFEDLVARLPGHLPFGDVKHHAVDDHARAVGRSSTRTTSSMCRHPPDAWRSR